MTTTNVPELCERAECRHFKTDKGECINVAGMRECHCFDFIGMGDHWEKCPEARSKGER